MATSNRLTAEIVDQISEHLRKGKPKRAAAAAVGIHRDTLNDWERAGRTAIAKASEGLTLNAREQLLAESLPKLELAVDEGESWLVDQIIETAQRGKPQWQAFATVLERTRPDVWQRKRVVEHSGGFNVTHSFDPSKLSDAELDVLERLLEKAAPARED